MTDKEVLSKCLTERNGKTILVPNVTKEKSLKKLGVYEYLLNRYKDCTNLQEILYRMFHKLEEHPVCVVCGNVVKFRSFSSGYTKSCCRNCAQKVSSNPDIIDVTDELIVDTLLVKENDKFSIHKQRTTIRNLKTNGLYNYLMNRFPDKCTISETLYRIAYNVKEKPLCPICGEPVKFNRFTYGYRKFCSNACYTKSEKYLLAKESSSNTMNDKSFASWTKKGNELGFRIEQSKDNNKLLVYDLCPIHNPFGVTKLMLHNRLVQNICVCPLCNPERNPTTSIEQTIMEVLDENAIQYIHHDRKLTHPYEIDFYVKDFNLAIECNGLYWHSEACNGKERLSNKVKLYDKLGLSRLILWEDTIKSKPEAVKNIILSKCNKNTKIGARKCNIRYIPASGYKDFIETYSTNDFGKSYNKHICIGLEYYDELVEVMLFEYLSQGEYVLVDICTKTGLSIVGGLTKLFVHFKKSNDWKKVVTYCDNDVCDGKIFEMLGFTKEGEPYQDYTYFNNKVSKQRILKETLEQDIKYYKSIDCIEKNGYTRCYNSSMQKYVLYK